MKLVAAKKVDMKKHDVITDCEVYLIYVKVRNIEKLADEMIQTISDTSWINTLKAAQQATFKATSRRTIVKLVNNINNRIENDALTEDFGEYMVSNTAQWILEKKHSHSKVPLAELVKGRISGNEGFDFHSESKNCHIVFGEAKYSGSKSPYKKALEQIKEFIDESKDMAELNVLEHFVTNVAMENCLDGNKAYTAAFSINARDAKKVLINAVKSDYLKSLLDHKEIYLIGVEVDDPAFD